YTRLTKTHKFIAAGLTAAGATGVVLGVVPAATAATHAPVKPVAWNAEAFGQTQDAELAKTADAAATQATTDAQAKVKAAADAAAKAKADAERKTKEQAASRAQARTALKPTAKPAAAKPAAPAPKAYADNLDGWITQALDIMKSKNIPGSYEGIKRNVMRESTGNPRAINDWDVNAVN
ncbi:lytic transglycosylase, partial [Streptomyces luteosporeus]|uniref:lytic transglycosylase n=1 Tax=Streptomyces luteosporeus TaxID=173856 RepID=UPI0031D66679